MLVVSTIIIDSREQNKEYIDGKFKSHGGITSMISCLSHGMDYLIMGESCSIGIQRKSGAAEIPKQMEALRDDILPALKELTENPILLIEEDFHIGSDGTFYRKQEGMMHPTGLNTKSYFNFIHSTKLSGVDVVCTRNLDASIWWMISTGLWVEQNHYPKIKKQYLPSMQAIGVLCCANGIGHTKAEKLLREHTLQELFAMDITQLNKVMTLNQTTAFMKMRGVKFY
jgi:ERCC4-type nuclease